MPLGYIQPTDGLARELREVAHDATALAAALQTGVNFELPPTSPRSSFSKSLAHLRNYQMALRRVVAQPLNMHAIAYLRFGVNTF